MSSPASPRGRSDVHKVSGSSSPSLWTDPVLASPSLSVQVPSPPSVSAQLPPVASASDKNWTPSQAPPVARKKYDHLW